MTGGGKEKLVVEVIGAHNLMPKDGEGSSSPFAEVEFDNQVLRTQVKYKDLNPIWNEKLVFHVAVVADLPYRTMEVNLFNEKRWWELGIGFGDDTGMAPSGIILNSVSLESESYVYDISSRFTLRYWIVRLAVYVREITEWYPSNRWQRKLSQIQEIVRKVNAHRFIVKTLL
ncbi:unnamed protein product [Rhodiola kirilowii]